MIKIKLLRKQHNLQQKLLAMELGVSQSVVSAWENGSKLPSFKNTVKIAEYFGVSTDYLLGKTNDPNSNSPTNKTTGQEIGDKLMQIFIDAGKYTPGEPLTDEFKEYATEIVSLAIKMAKIASKKQY